MAAIRLRGRSCCMLEMHVKCVGFVSHRFSLRDIARWAACARPSTTPCRLKASRALAAYMKVLTTGVLLRC